MIRAITPITASALFALAIGCNNPAEKQVNERSEARKEINQAGQDAQEKVANAREDLAEAEKKFGEKVGDAQKEIADEAKEGAKEIGDADQAASDKLMEAKYERFEILKNESESAFATRADATIARLQTDLDTATQRSTAAGATKDMQEAVKEAGEALAEARTDLVELRGKTGKLFDDGRLGVGTAINKAQRELTEAYEEMAEAKM
ncbi:MAG TPA: hypothetical protein VG755_23645 [Nannocystaceae bacterium]|nr:hypothetical protein [Nannocystaceae bacterium]